MVICGQVASPNIDARIMGSLETKPFGDSIEAWRSNRTTVLLGALHNTTEVVPHSLLARSADEEFHPCPWKIRLAR